MTWSFDITFSLVVMLAICVGFVIWRRVSRPVSEAQWTGHGLNGGAVLVRIARVREAFEAESRVRSRRASQGLLASARSAVFRMPYFRKRSVETQ